MEGSWQTDERGYGQLHELNSMIRRQEGHFGSTFALFMIANAVLVFSFYQQEDHFLARSAISAFALAVNGALFLMLMEAKGYLELWMSKALALESDLGITQEFRVWGEGPKSLSMPRMCSIAAAGLLVYWGVCLSFAAVSYLQ